MPRSVSSAPAVLYADDEHELREDPLPRCHSHLSSAVVQLLPISGFVTPSRASRAIWRSCRSGRRRGGVAGAHGTARASRARGLRARPASMPMSESARGGAQTSRASAFDTARGATRRRAGAPGPARRDARPSKPLDRLLYRARRSAVRSGARDSAPPGRAPSRRPPDPREWRRTARGVSATGSRRPVRVGLRRLRAVPCCPCQSESRGGARPRGRARAPRQAAEAVVEHRGHPTGTCAGPDASTRAWRESSTAARRVP
jgi:hypothetical protein